jgi:hypothetical protein
MTTPTDRTRALVQTKQFLRELTDKTDMPRVPQTVRDIARRLIKHYPTYADIARAHEAMPERYAPFPLRWHLPVPPQTGGAFDATSDGEE